MEAAENLHKAVEALSAIVEIQETREQEQQQDSQEDEEETVQKQQKQQDSKQDKQGSVQEQQQQGAQEERKEGVDKQKQQQQQGAQEERKEGVDKKQQQGAQEESKESVDKQKQQQQQQQGAQEERKEGLDKKQQQGAQKEKKDGCLPPRAHWQRAKQQEQRGVEEPTPQQTDEPSIQYDSFFLFAILPDKTKGVLPRKVEFKMGRYKIRLERSYEDMFAETTGMSLHLLTNRWSRKTLSKLAMATLKYSAGLRKHRSPWLDMSEGELWDIICERSVNGLSYGYSVLEVGQIPYNPPKEIKDLMPKLKEKNPEDRPSRMSDFWYSDKCYKGLYPLGEKDSTNNDASIIREPPPMHWSERDFLLKHFKEKEKQELLKRYGPKDAGKGKEPEKDGAAASGKGKEPEKKGGAEGTGGDEASATTSTVAKDDSGASSSNAEKQENGNGIGDGREDGNGEDDDSEEEEAEEEEGAAGEGQKARKKAKAKQKSKPKGKSKKNKRG